MNKEKQAKILSELCPACHMDEEGAYRWHWPSNRYFSPLTDLNAMHEVEKTLAPNECDKYESLLGVFNLSTDPVDKRFFHRSASKRAEALLKLRGLWDYEPASNKV